MSIELIGVTKTYRGNAGNAVRALDDVTLSVGHGEWLAVMGPSGSGKSTLVNILGCLDRADKGAVIIDGEDIADVAATASQLDRFRAEKIGFIFQQFHLIPYLDALENVMLAQYLHSMTDKQQALEALARVGLKDRAHHLPSQLSGGEQQRVCIARALINDPRIILADEPTGNLDAANEEIVLRLLRELHAQGRTIIMVTHDPVVSRLATRRIELHHGRIAAENIFEMSDEQQIDEILEEIWVLMENSERAEPDRMSVAGALPMSLVLDNMEKMGLVTRHAHSAEAPHSHKLVLNRCHAEIQALAEHDRHGDDVIYFTEKGRTRAESIIRRHRLAERLFMQTFQVSDEREVEQQACKFEHILSAEATDRICTFLGHPETCPHGSAIPRGACCVLAETARKLQIGTHSR